MKEVTKRSLFILIVFIATQSYANVVDSIIIENNEKQNMIKIGNLNSEYLLKIKDMDGMTLHQEEINDHDNYLKSFDMSQLPDATYYFELDNEQEIKIIPIHIKDQQPNLIKSEELSITKPSLKTEGSLVHVQQVANSDQNLDVSIYFEGNELIFEESFKDTSSVLRTYDFSKSPKGEYTIVFNTEGRTFVNEISIANISK